MVGTPATPLYDRIPQSNGLLFGSYSEAGTFITVKDPQCGKLASSLQPLCTLNAVASPFGAITTKTLGGFVNASATQRTFQGQLRFNFEILFGNWAIGTSANCAAPKHKRRRRSPEESKKNSLDEFPSWLNSTRRKASFWISCR